MLSILYMTVTCSGCGASYQAKSLRMEFLKEVEICYEMVYYTSYLCYVNS